MAFLENIFLRILSDHPTLFFLSLSVIVFSIAFIACHISDFSQKEDTILAFLFNNFLRFFVGLFLLNLFALGFWIIQKEITQIAYCFEAILIGMFVSFICLPPDQRQLLRVVVPAMLKIGERWKGESFSKSVKDILQEELIDKNEK